MKGLHRVAPAALSALLLAAPLSAQVPAPDVPSAKAASPDTAAVASRLGTAPATATIRIVTREEIAQMPGVRALADVLVTLLGMDVRRRGPNGIQADVGTRGSDFNGTLLLVDGELMTDPGSGHLSADFDVPLAAVERIEVLLGAGSALWGAGAVGGVVNIVTRGADLGRSNMQLEARYGHGSDSLDAGGYRAALKVTDSISAAVDWFRSETSGFRDDTDSASSLLRVSGRWETGAGPVTLGLGYAGRNFGAYGFAGPECPDARDSTRTRTATLSGALLLGGWTLTPSAFVRAHHDDLVLDRNDPALNEDLQDSAGGVLRVAARHAFLGGNVAFGIEGGRETISSPGLGDHTRNDGALFAEVGRDWDRDAPAGGGFRAGLRADGYEGYGSRLSPYAGASWRADPALMFRASFGTSFRVPSFTELYQAGPEGAGDPNLRPEKAWSVDAGATLALSSVTLDAAYFHRHAVDLVDFVRSSPDSVWQARNLREADTDGIEAAVDWSRGRPAFLMQLRLQAAYTFTDLASLSAAAGGATEGQFVLDPLHTKWDVLLGVALPFAVTATSRVSYLARPSFTDGVWLLSARLSWQAFQGRILEFFVDGDNLGDSRYEEVPGVPLPGRTLFAGFNLTW